MRDSEFAEAPQDEGVGKGPGSTDIELSPALLDHGAGKLRQECNVYSHRPSTTPKPRRGGMFSEHCAPTELECVWRLKTINIAALRACRWPAAIANSMAVGRGENSPKTFFAP